MCITQCWNCSLLARVIRFHFVLIIYQYPRCLFELIHQLDFKIFSLFTQRFSRNTTSLILIFFHRLIKRTWRVVCINFVNANLCCVSQIPSCTFTSILLNVISLILHFIELSLHFHVSSPYSRQNSNRFYPPFKKMSIPNLKNLNHQKNKNKRRMSMLFPMLTIIFYKSFSRQLMSSFLGSYLWD
jgi:hypothetical protein